MEQERRFIIRANIDSPIFYFKDHEPSYHKARIYNVSRDGMCLGADQGFSRGEHFFIKMHESLPGFETAGPYEACVAEVKWCSRKDIENFKLGVRQIGKATVVNKEEFEISHLACDVCGNSRVYKVVKTDDYIHLCLNCYAWMARMNGNSMKDRLTRYIVGNVI